MFGGFSADFWDAYHEVIPKLQPYYDERQQLYQLYHQLNHAALCASFLPFAERSGGYRVDDALLFSRWRRLFELGQSHYDQAFELGKESEQVTVHLMSSV